jgi:hypothetical protein
MSIRIHYGGAAMNKKPSEASAELLSSPSRRGFILRLFSFIGASVMVLSERRPSISAEIYAPPAAHRLYLPCVVREGKDPISDKDPGEKDPASDKSAEDQNIQPIQPKMYNSPLLLDEWGLR